MSERAAAVTDAPEWAPAVDARLTRVGIWILLVADLFFFAAFFFAFFYLRSLNNDNSWLPAGTPVPARGIGALLVALVIATAVLHLAGVRMISSAPGMGRTLLWLALAAGVLFCAAQVYEFRHLGFDPQLGGGYSSVFVGLKGALLVQFVGALLWLGTHIAQARPRGDLFTRTDTAVAFSNFLLFLAGISLIAYIVLYFV